MVHLGFGSVQKPLREWVSLARMSGCRKERAPRQATRLGKRFLLQKCL